MLAKKILFIFLSFFTPFLFTFAHYYKKAHYYDRKNKRFAAGNCRFNSH